MTNMKTKNANSTMMTAKTDQVTSSARIRDNQRRSRARRREYIQDLEHRLQKFEAHGVQVTQEIQAAGRKVAVENTLLRALLQLHGVSDHDIEGYLAAHTGDIVSSTSHSEALPEPKPHLCKGRSGNAVSSSSSQPISLNESRGPFHENETATPEPTSSPSSPAASRQVAIPQSQCSNTGQPVPDEPPTNDPSRLQSRSRNQDPGQSTPCETAAGILTSMRSYPDAQDVRSELGCQSSSSCMVRNMDIFQLLDGR
ncbi:uncharacterized protein APUU_10194A [Aspergillus puulaauensis]|uniref:BZIP domain-containing protein n=1 Tax=Aspergillus puulaauensis TaxID=1220207 RepID=A0A7R8AFW5_9EURO|nr:uncharacterized protein APUU_10194A [Aspergillus puulaauensis]BCS17366.1 hypothetical protein APUU_10194A [Aspergillus puulaauensis]